MISVILPVLEEREMTSNILNNISVNTIKPDEIVLIDNSSTHDIQNLVPQYTCLDIVYLKQKKNIGVNASWNLGIERAQHELISILNNDLILNNLFFENIEKVMVEYPDVGICVPNTTKEIPIDNPNTKIAILGTREGWAFTIRSEIAKRALPIPETLFMFFGDDYLFHFARSLGYKIVKVLNNEIVHLKETTVRKVLGKKYQDTLDKEGKEWRKIYDKIYLT